MKILPILHNGPKEENFIVLLKEASNQAILFLSCFFQKCLIFRSSSFSKNVIIPRNFLLECFPRSILPLTFPNSPSNYLFLTSVTFFYVVMRTFQKCIFPDSSSSSDHCGLWSHFSQWLSSSKHWNFPRVRMIVSFAFLDNFSKSLAFFVYNRKCL